MKNLKDEIEGILDLHFTNRNHYNFSGLLEAITSLIEQEKERAVREFVNYIIVRETPVGAVTVNDKLRFLIDGLGQYLAERKEQFLKESEGK